MPPLPQLSCFAWHHLLVALAILEAAALQALGLNHMTVWPTQCTVHVLLACMLSPRSCGTTLLPGKTWVGMATSQAVMLCGPMMVVDAL